MRGFDLGLHCLKAIVARHLEICPAALSVCFRKRISCKAVGMSVWDMVQHAMSACSTREVDAEEVKEHEESMLFLAFKLPKFFDLPLLIFLSKRYTAWFLEFFP